MCTSDACRRNIGSFNINWKIKLVEDILRRGNEDITLLPSERNCARRNNKNHTWGGK